MADSPARVTVSPSEVRAREGTLAVLGGRLVHLDADGTGKLADAFASIDVDLGCAIVQEGDLLEVEGTLERGRLLGGRVISRSSPAVTSGDDVRRFLLAGGGERLVARAKVLSTIRAVFREEDFLEVETPILVPSPGLDVHLDAVEADGGFLATSPEYQMKRLLAGGVPRCFQLSRCFRKGERGALHNPEFTMLEWYRAFAGYDAVIADTERIVRETAVALRGSATLSVGARTIAVEPPFPRITVAEAFARHAGQDEAAMLNLAANDEEQFFRLMVDAVEPALAALPHPVFLIDYPVQQASLARRKPSNERYAERFELYVGGVELCNGFGELTCATEQRARLEQDQRARAARNLPVYPIDERFLDALEAGLPRCAGNALGVDRLVALAVGVARIGDVQAFPHDVL